MGDGDHGTAMKRGFNEANNRINNNLKCHDPGTLLSMAGAGLASGTGGASGLLFSSLFKELGEAGTNMRCVGVPEFKNGLLKSIERIRKLGRSGLGDKTMLDALYPAYVALENIDDDIDLLTAVEQMVINAKDGKASTKNLPAKRGRGRYVENRGIGTVDPGANSVTYIFETLEHVLRSKS